MLTHLQHRTLSLIHKKLDESGVSPSYRELANQLGKKGWGQIRPVLDALEERGFIRRLPGRARAIEIIKLPENIGRKG